MTGQPLKYAVVITGDASGLEAEAARGERSLERVGDAARDVAADAQAMERALDQAARAAGAGRPVVAPPAGATPAAPRPGSQPSIPPARPAPTPGARAPIEAWRHQNAAQQYIDIGVSAFSGQNPATIAVQQLPQLVSAYGGVRETLSAVAQAATVSRVAIGGLTGVVVAGAAAWNSYLVSVKEVETARAGLGRFSGATAAELADIAVRAAAAGDVSIRTARSIEAALLRTGKIGAESFEPIIAMTKDFAATIGSDVDTAAAELTKLFADPAKGAETLFRQYGLIDGATARYVQKLVDQNRLEEARAAMAKALPQNLASAKEATTALGRAWEAATNAAINYVDRIVDGFDRAVSGPRNLSEEVEQAEENIRKLQAAATDLGLDSLPDLPKAIAERDGLRRRQADEQREAEERARGRQADLNVSGAIAAARASPASAHAGRRRELLAEQRTLQQGLDNGLLDTERAEAARALDATTEALRTLIPEAERKRRLDEIDLQLQQARTPAERAALEARRATVELMGQEVTAAEARAAAAQASTRALEEARIAGRERALQAEQDLDQARLELSLMGATNAERARAIALFQAERSIRDQKMDPESGEAERIRAAAGDRAETETRGDRLRSARGILQGQRDDAERIALETRLIGASNEVRAREIALLEARQRIRAAELTGTPQAALIEANARAIAAESAALERQQAAWEKVKSAGEGAVDRLSQAMTDPTASWKDAVEASLGDVQKMLAEASFANPIKNALFGSDLPTMGDLGGAVGRLFGLGGNEASSAVTAATAALGATAETAMWVKLAGVSMTGLGSAVTAVTAATGAPTGGGVPSLAATGGAPSRAVDLASGLVGFSENRNPAEINSFLQAGGVDLDAARQAWCAAFVNSSLAQVGVDGTGSQVATSFLNWGARVDPAAALRGDVLVQARGRSPGQIGGHVGFATGETRMGPSGLQLQMLSGNASNRVQTDWRDAAGLDVRRAAGAPAVDTTAIEQSFVGLHAATREAATAIPTMAAGAAAAAPALAGVGQEATGLGGILQNLLGGMSGIGGGGGVAGAGGGAGGFVASLLQAFLPKFHAGGDIGGPHQGPLAAALGATAADERLIIARTGERVSTPAQAAANDAMIRSARATRAPQVVVNTITAPQLAPIAAGEKAAQSGSGRSVKLNIVNPPGVQLKAEEGPERTNADGEREMDVVLSEMVANRGYTPGGPLARVQRDVYGQNRAMTRRS